MSIWILDNEIITIAFFPLQVHILLIQKKGGH